MKLLKSFEKNKIDKNNKINKDTDKNKNDIFRELISLTDVFSLSISMSLYFLKIFSTNKMKV